MVDKFSVGAMVRIKTDNPGDVKRVPHYIKGKVGVVQKFRGIIDNPRDHRDERPPLYSVLFSPADIFTEKSENDKVVVDVFEDWMIPQ